MKQTTCPYNYCPIPEKNTVFLWESAYMLAAAIALINFPNTMTNFSVILLLFPAILELIFTKPRQVVVAVVIWLFRIVDGAVIFLCVLGLASIIEYKGNAFFVPSTAIFLPGIRILPKKVFAGILIANLIPPLAYYFGNPCKKNLAKSAE